MPDRGRMWSMGISTKRLVLREFTAEDLGAVHAYAADPAVCAFVEWGPNTIEETVAFLRQCREEKLARPRQTVTLAVTRNSILIGSIALMLADSDLVRGAGEAGIGYVLRADAWGRGYAAAVLELARNAFGSTRVLEKIGKHQIDYLRGHKHIPGEARDSVVFASSFSAGDAASTAGTQHRKSRSGAPSSIAAARTARDRTRLGPALDDPFV